MYIRDGRAPLPIKGATSKVMSSNKAKGNKLEVLFGKLLYKNGLRGYRKNCKILPGRPDICYSKYKLAIFIHGCFWHRCPICNLPLPKSHTKFWEEKFEKNKARDKIKKQSLEKKGWKVLTFWECQIKDNPHALISLVKSHINNIIDSIK